MTDPPTGIIEDRLTLLDTLTLAANSHDSWDDGACVMEAVAFIAGEPWSDHPQCASPVIGAFLRSWNDRLPDDDRQDLKPYIPRLVGSRGTDEQETLRAWMATDWLVREQTPRWFRLAGMTAEADTLAGLQPLNAETIPSIRPKVIAIRDETWARRRAWREEFKVRFLKAFAVAGVAADVAAAAAAVAVADAVAVAANVGSTEEWWRIRDAVFRAVKDLVRVKVNETIAPHRDEFMGAAHDLVDRMLKVTEAAA